MIQFYYARPSLFARPVWFALLEKGLPFDPVVVDLAKGAQFEPEFIALNPFGHIPVLVDQEFRVIESQAILDYLEAKYPEPVLLPSDPESLARVRMVQMVAIHELLPGIGGLLVHHKTPDEVTYSQARITTVLRFLEDLLGDRPICGGGIYHGRSRGGNFNSRFAPGRDFLSILSRS
ncbi:MAG: glutathione S-transferase family protein [Oscillatoriales cyanobacterium RM2_1_1]|nr:glutathione S-transferase family protein [Oscillatoriales cyanobacterium RM2_1_1]